MPQGSVTGPILFIIFTAALASVVERHGLSLTSTLSTAKFTILAGLPQRLPCRQTPVNAVEMEVMWFISYLRDLGVLIDSDLGAATRVWKTVS